MGAPILASTLALGSEPQAFDLTILDNLKSYLFSGGAPSNIDDDLLQRLISSASAAIQSWLGYEVGNGTKLAATPYTETVDSVDDGAGWPNRWLYSIPVRWSPIQSVASVTMDGRVIPSGGDGVRTPGYFFDSTDPVQIYVGGFWPIPRARKNIVVSYVGGYAAIPYDVEQACLETVALRYREIDRIGLRSKSMAGETISYIVTALSPSAQAALGSYRRMVLG